MLAHLVIVLLLGAAFGYPAGEIEIQEPDIGTYYEQAGDHFQGDIVLTDVQADAVESGRTALIGPSYMWPDRTVYYTIKAGDFTSSQITSIQQALQQISLVSCVKFVERTTQKDYVLVTGENTGCWSYLGRRGNSQQLNLQPIGCMSRGTIIHEFLHALGFVHMQSASDRDFYIQIAWNNIETGRSTNFDRYASTLINDFGIPYDYESVMHYGKTAFSKNGQPTIIPYDDKVTIGQRVGLSYKDIKRLNTLYTCNDQTYYEQVGDYFQGDIKLVDTQANAVKSGQTALIGTNNLWPDRTLYYKIRSGDFAIAQITSIRQALQEISQVSCVKFVERTIEKDYVLVTGENSGCFSYLGRRGISQQLNLQPNGCLGRGTIIHEFLHALGFVHMQSASNRDSYVQIAWNNIEPGTEHNFDRLDSTVIDDLGIPYDYESLMHYAKTAFSKNGQPTIIPKDSTATIGQRAGMSDKDIQRLNKLYNCN